MPIHKCQRKGKTGYQWGKSGKCYTGVGARARARRQERAIRAHGYGSNVYNARRNPLRADPSRTSTLRRQFETDLHKRFKRIIAAIYKLIVEEDALGLKVSKPFTFNVFCPTGPGGGIDPTCSPGGGGGAAPTVSETSTVRQLTGPEQYTVSHYKNTGYNHVNDVLRKGTLESASESTKQEVQTLDKLIAGSPVPEDTTLYRVVDGKRAGDKYMKVGAVVEDKAFMSTSTGEFKAMRAVEDAAGGRVKTATTLEIRVPKGTPAFDLQAHTVGGAILKPQLDEGEYLLGRGTSLRIVSADPDSRRVIAEVVGKSVSNQVANQQQWRFRTDPDKVAAFQDWLRQEVKSNVLPDSTPSNILSAAQEQAYWERYVAEGYKKGAGRAFDDTRKGATKKKGAELDFYRGTKEQFLRSAFGRPESVNKVKLLAGRTFTDLKGVTEEMSTRMTRALTDGLVQGKHPNAIAKDLVKQVGLSEGRAKTIARTEIIRVHAEGALDALEELGVEEIGVMVEWSTAGDDVVCPLCEVLEGIVMTVQEAHGMFPRHPNCRCTPIPANVGEPEPEQKRGMARVTAAIKSSVKREGGKRGSSWQGARKKIAKTRPRASVRAKR